MALSVVSAVLLLTVGGASVVGSAGATRTAVAQPGGQRRGVQLLDLPSVRRLFNSLARQLTSADEAERVAAWTDVSVLAGAVAGEALVGPLVFDDLTPTTTDQVPRVLLTAAVTERDKVAYQLLSLGYSAHETADVASGRISKRALDTARGMLGRGLGRDMAANYLDRQYQLALALKHPPEAEAEERRTVSPSPFEATIIKAANVHNVDAALVRAMIGVESAFDPAARSRAGALGLMQLMPATARELGVNPLVPEQNIDGGVRYMSGLLKMFGGTELALVAYNGGPGFARRYAMGETALYGETRDYVNRVLARARTSR